MTLFTKRGKKPYQNKEPRVVGQEHSVNKQRDSILHYSFSSQFACGDGWHEAQICGLATPFRSTKWTF